ncbi:MAG: TonB-dependent receptor plug domain-containing protein, partial [Bacteroidota bacterium]
MRFYLLLFLLLWTTWIAAQQKTISGQVTDAETGIPMVGATLMIQGSDPGTVTDLEGKFSLLAMMGDSVVVSYIGYANFDFRVDGRDVYDLQLSSSETLFDEIVVTALGLERSSKGLGYAFQQLESQEITEIKSVNFLDNLSGKLAGVTINQGATGVGSSSRIVIRGESSFTNNNPLFIVDGIPINNNTTFNFTNEAAAGFQEIDFGNGAMEVNPDDIASVSVLKGPSAAALYGTRASNGAIIINTKDGSKSTGLGISFNTTTYVDRAFRLPQFQNRYGQGNSGAFEFVDGLGGGTNDNITYSYGPELDVGNLVSQYDSPVTLANGQ